MGAPLGIVPRGLLGMLELKDYGESPKFLAETVATTIETLPLYMLGRRETRFFSVNTAAVGVVEFGVANQSPLVAPGETWYVWDFNVIASAGAGTALRFGAGVLPQAGVAFSIGDYQSVAAGEELRLRAQPTPFYLTAGDRLCALVQSVTGVVQVAGFAQVTVVRT